MDQSKHTDNALRTIVVCNAEQMAHAFAVRSICFLEERGFAFRQEFDGNDYHASHFVMYAGDEPIGTSRVRWFAEFARIERTAFRPAFRSTRILRRYADFVFAHVAQKGYSKLVTVAGEKYARVWERMLGFERIPGRETKKPDQEEVFHEMIKHLEVPADAITLDTPPRVAFRTEGAWDAPGRFG